MHTHTTHNTHTHTHEKKMTINKNNLKKNIITKTFTNNNNNIKKKDVKIRKSYLLIKTMSDNVGVCTIFRITFYLVTEGQAVKVPLLLPQRQPLP